MTDPAILAALVRSTTEYIPDYGSLTSKKLRQVAVSLANGMTIEEIQDDLGIEDLGKFIQDELNQYKTRFH